MSIKPRKSNAAGLANITISALGLDSHFARKCSFDGSYDNFVGVETMVQNSSTVPFLGTSLATCFTPVWARNDSQDTLWNPLARIRNGLAATYYVTSNFSSAALSAISFEVDFSKAFGSSLLPQSVTAGTQLPNSVSDGNMGIRWAGFLQPEFAVTYTMKVLVHDIDERIKMWIDSALIVDQWTSLHSTEGSATWGFANANSFYDIHLEYQQHTGSMGLQLQWKREDEIFSMVNSARLFLPVPGWGHTSLSISEGLNGLFATYYGSTSFDSALFTKVDTLIEQQQSDIIPSRAEYSIRWSGFLKPSLAQTYTMYATLAEPDQRVRLWVDNTLIVDQWLSLIDTQVQGTVAFGAAFAHYRVLMEYKQRGPAPMGASLSWKRGPAKTLVPPSAFFMKSSTSQVEHVTIGSTRFTFSGFQYKMSKNSCMLHVFFDRFTFEPQMH